MESEDKNLLVVIFDVNPYWWGIKQAKDELSINRCLDSILVFMNSYRMLKHDNSIALIASHSTKSKYLYPLSESEKQVENGCEDTHLINRTISENFRQLMNDGCDESDIRTESQIAGSLCMALCYINKVKSKQLNRSSINARILVVKASEDSPSQYLSFMNCVFAAQKNSIVVDACILGQNSALLQQACDMTKGLYLQCCQEDAFLQYLMTAFVSEASLRNESLAISVKNHQNGDDAENLGQTACHCCRKFIEIGFVCSLCLSIYCKYTPICLTCQAVYPSRLKAKKRKIAA